MKKCILGLVVGFSFGVFAEVAGTYSWVAVGCRDSSLSAASHESKLASDNPSEISAATLVLNSDGSASMRAVQSGEVVRNSGRYEERGNKLVFFNEGENDVVFEVTVVDGELIGVEEDDVSERVCGEGKYVYVLSRAS